MSVLSLGTQHLTLRSAEDVHEVFRQLGYDVYDPEPFEGDDLDQLDLTDIDREVVNRAYIVASRDNHTVYLYEVKDMRQIRLRGLAWNALERGTALLVVTMSDYREILFVDPRFVSKPNKSNVRVNKLKVLSNAPTRHDLDTLNAIHAHRRTGQQIYDAQAEAFNITTITKKFYDEYRRHYEHARAMIRQYNLGVREFQNSDQTDKLHAFTQRLLGRLMFLYFLQRKGWLGERQKFLTEKYLETMRNHAHELNGDRETFYYYTEVLQPLFFETLNTKRPDNITRWQGIRIPYLNGGLFDESRDPKGPIILPDSLFDPNSNEGLLAFFNRYNFTIEDDTPLEQDVSVDPEMLGKVFENMLEERDRGQSGSFYTPRTIVSYMCQEALSGYLEESADISRDTTRAQFDPDSELRYTAEEAVRVNSALDTMTALDPAVGSGSFLIGMLIEMMRLRKACYIALNDGQDAPRALLAEWKEAIIRNTLYGVDIKPEAIEIAQLRLWLALVVDQTLEQARPLPNLDYKLMAGNSLIETIDGKPILTTNAQNMLNSPTQPQQLNMFTTAAEENRKLEDLRDEYFHATPEARKQLSVDIRFQERRIIEVGLNDMLENVNQQINLLDKKYPAGAPWRPADANKKSNLLAKSEHLQTLKNDLWKDEATLPFFLYRLHFNDVFARKGGFDVVVANPPYVRGDTLGNQKDELQVTYAQVYSGRADLYVYFFARGFNLLKPNGQLAYITSNKYLRTKYGKGLRGFLSSQIKIQSIIDFGDLPVFDAAAYPCIVIGSSGNLSKNDIATISIKDVGDLDYLHKVVDSASISVEQAKLDDNIWQITDRQTGTVLNRMRSDSTALGDIVSKRVHLGIITGMNDVFVINQDLYERLINQNSKSKDILKSIVLGKDVARWHFSDTRKYLILTKRGINIDEYPAILTYLLEHKEKLKNRSTVKAGNHPWYELQQPGIFPLFDNPKIAYPDIASDVNFVLDRDGVYLGNTVYFIPVDDLYLLGILNSSATKFFYNYLSPQIRGGYFRFFTQYVEQIPIPDAPDDLREKIATLAQQCLDMAKDAPEKLPTLEAALNQLVYQAYGLDEDDIRVIEGNLSGGYSRD